ncbi:chaperonin 10-like protein [Thelonectria olida]|uniref:Chaperonin 10-like protein n=1 Tax=Thelonectria olida TaxID=1576542 RepID=A0A9P9AJ90_9HYPO|nr:chaperonin 10-like protein [Thelonectria olida]
MMAFQYDNSAAGLQLRDISDPEPGPEYVQLEVKAVGICHSDCHIVSGTSDAWLTKKPITLGHEVAGIITKVGHGITQFCPGDRVAVSQICHPVEERDWTLSIGLGFDGGYAQYAVAPVCRLVRIPDCVSFAQAAVATDALASSYHAVAVEAGAKPGITVGVIGLGGLGMSGLAFGTLRGAIVYGIDILKDKFEEAQRLGAHGCFKSLDDAKNVSFDVIVDFAGTGSTMQAALSAVKEGGKVVIVGLSAQILTVPTEVLVMRTVTLVGSLGASADDLAEVIDALAKGGVKGRLWTDPSKAVK